MNEELNNQNGIIENKLESAVITVDQPKETSMTPIQFEEKVESKIVTVDEKPATLDKTGALVENAFQQAIVHEVTTNNDVQENLLSGAKKVIENKVEALKTQADTEAKNANFNNKKGACECFGYNENTTERWAVNAMNIWQNIMTGIWIIIGAVTFAPITFVAKKIKVILKASWVSILFAILLYFIIATGPVWWQYFWDWIMSLVKQ